MPQTIKVPNPITALQFTAMDASITSVDTILDGANVPLTESQTISMISVSTVRSAEIVDVNNIVIGPFPVTVPGTIEAADFETNVAYIASLKKRQSALLTEAGKMQTLINVAENNAIVDVNLIMNNARLLAGGDNDIKEAVAKITAKYFTKSAVKKASGYTIVAGGVINIGSVKTGKKFTNTGTTILSVLQAGANITTAIKVNPSSGIDIAKGWTNVVVTNLSAVDAGAFSLFVK